MYEKVCVKCGTTLSSFYATGMLGCPHCYKEFEKEIIPALKKIQGRVFHAGKTPKISSVDRELLSEYERLLKEKEQATFNGEFDKMRSLTIEINQLVSELKERGLI